MVAVRYVLKGPVAVRSCHRCEQPSHLPVNGNLVGHPSGPLVRVYRRQSKGALFFLSGTVEVHVTCLTDAVDLYALPPA